MTSYKKEWENMVKENHINILEEMGGFKAGDLVEYTNENGVKFTKQILGFRTDYQIPKNTVYLDKDSYWFCVPISSIKPIKTLAV